MGLSALLLVQALASLAPTIENVLSLPTVVELERSAASVAPAALALSGAIPNLIPDSARARAIGLSDGYYTRLDVHRYAAYGTLPLFLLEYVAGQKLLTKGSAAPLWAEKVHKPAAYLVAGIFTVNTVTGVWNLVEAGKIRQGKTRRVVHSILMLASDAGFIYSASKAPTTSKIDARIASGKVGGWTPHKISAVASMGVSTVAYLMMFLWKGE